MDYFDNKEKYREIIINDILKRLKHLDNKNDMFKESLNKTNLSLFKVNENISKVSEKQSEINNKIITLTNVSNKLVNNQQILNKNINNRINKLEHKLDISVKMLKHIPTISKKEILDIYNMIKENIKNQK